MATVTSYSEFVDQKILENSELESNIDIIIDRISQLLNIDRNRFEKRHINQYDVRRGHKLHVDYFTGIDLHKNLEHGGNRTHTVILDLNTVETGGIWFPWLQRLEKTVGGKLTVIDYSDDDSRSRIESEYQILSGKTDRKLLVFYIRQHSVDESYTGARKNYHYYSNPLKTTELDIECGPENDRRVLHLELEPNNRIGTGLVVGFTSGMDSSLLLYLLATINSYQTIPYVIQPVVVDNRLGSGDYPDNRFFSPINESWTSILRMTKFIKSEIPNGMIQDPVRYTASPKHRRYYQTSLGLHDYFTERNQLGPNKYVGLYEAVLENIPELENPPNIKYDSSWPWKLPFANIQKHHVIDIIIELGLEKIFEITSKCPSHHETLTESCDLQWQCQERRLGFVKLGKEDLGEKYLLNYDK